MTCGGCGAVVGEEARFCPECGARQPEEDPAAVAEYKAAFESLAGRTEPWAEAELRALRVELRIREATHAGLVAQQARAAVAPVSVWVDATPIADFRVGEQCLLRVRVVNESGRALAGVELALSTTAAAEALADRSPQVVGPGEEQVLSVLFRATVAGAHHATGRIALTPLRGAPSRWQLEAVPFQVGGANALHQQIHIDASANRVGIFENIGAASKGGLVGGPDWRRVRLSEAREEAPRVDAQALAVGRSGVGRVTPGPELAVELDGVVGLLVEVEPALRTVLRPGDQLQVTVLGHDAAGRPLLSDRGRPGAAPAVGRASVGPGEDLHAALRSGASSVTVTGTHQGPFVVERPLELIGDGATLESATGPALKLAADVVLRGLTVRGVAPAGAYAADAVEVRSGRVVFEGCTLSADAPGNLVPGRALAVSGPATVELRGCTLAGSGLGIAVDVSWSGFPTDTARGARVRMLGGRLERLGTGVAVAGADREVHLSGVVVDRVADAVVRVLKGATAGVEGVAIDGVAVDRSKLTAEPGGNLIVKG